MNCAHHRITTWELENGEPVGLWSCVECRLKFVPITETDELRSLLRRYYDIYAGSTEGPRSKPRPVDADLDAEAAKALGVERMA